MDYREKIDRKIIRIIGFAKGDREVPSSNDRLWLLADNLRRAYGWEFDIFAGIAYPFWSFSRKRYSVWRSVIRALKTHRYNAIFVQKVMFPFDIALLIFVAKWWYDIPLIYDVDDPQWDNARAQDWLISYCADRIFCSAPAFMEYYRPRNSHVLLVPTVFDHEYYARFKITYEKKEYYTIGWVGSGIAHFKLGNFQIIKPVLEELNKKGFKIRFLLVGTRNYDPLLAYFRSDSYQCEFIDYVPMHEVPTLINRFDVAFAPLMRGEWTETNAAAKGIEYMACGVPTIASAVGVYKILIRDGENGFLADSQKEWVVKTEHLLNDVALRKHIGEAGMVTVRERYSYASLLPKIKHEMNMLD